jgi:hydroxypyruvate reductase
LTPAAWRAHLREAFVAARARVDLRERVRDALGRSRFGGRGVSVVAVGKAAPAMAAGALDALGEAVSRLLVVAPDATPCSFDDARVTVLRAAHPDPDRRSVVAATRALEVARDADALLVLVSGGASSLLYLPRGMPLRRYVATIRALRLRGADVRELNVVRRHLCGVKGGGLARVARGPVRTLIASDVLGGEPRDVGSGPSVGDPTTMADARRILRRWLPDQVVPRLHETTSLEEARRRGWRSRMVAEPGDLARALAERLRTQGLRVHRLRASFGSVDALASEYLQRAARLSPGEALVRAAEPSLAIPSRGAGRGGRSTHLACLVARGLAPGVAFLAGASDGDDGRSGTGGAVVDGSLERRAGAAVVSLALVRFDTGRLVRRVGMDLSWGPTGTNLADVHVLARA